MEGIRAKHNNYWFPKDSNHGIPKGYNYWASPNHGFPSGNNCLIPSRRETMEGIRAKHNNYW